MGRVDLVVKVYFRNVHPKFPDGGVMSQHLNGLKLGNTVGNRSMSHRHGAQASAQLAFQGPKGRFTYKNRGVFAVKQLPSQARCCCSCDTYLSSGCRAAVRSCESASTLAWWRAGRESLRCCR